MNATATATASDFAPQKGESYFLSLSPDFFDPDDEQKAKEVWEAEQASANLPMSGQDEDDIERMRKEFDEVLRFNHNHIENHT